MISDDIRGWKMSEESRRWVSWNHGR